MLNVPTFDPAILLLGIYFRIQLKELITQVPKDSIFQRIGRIPYNTLNTLKQAILLVFKNWLIK